MTNQNLLDHLRTVGEALGHQPSRREFDYYGSIPINNLESHFDTYQQALKEADLDLQSVRTIEEPLDEPPDTSAEIPSHVNLLRELRYLVERKGRADAQKHFSEIGTFRIEHYNVQFGSLDNAFELLQEVAGSETYKREYVPRRMLVDEVRQFGEFLQRAPSLLELLYYSNTSLKKFSEKFDSLADIHSAAGYDSNKILPANDKLLEDIQKVGNEFGRPPTVEEYAEYGEFDHSYAIRRFDGWIPTLNASGYDLLSSAPTLEIYRTNEVSRVRFNSILQLQTGVGAREVLLDDIYRLQHQFSEPLSYELISEYGRYPPAAYQSTLGGINEAISSIGLSSSDEGVDSKKLDQSLQSAFADIGMTIKREPTQKEVDALGQFLGITYVARFDSWESTLNACTIPFELDSEDPETPYALLWELDRIAKNIGHSPRLGVLQAKGQYDLDQYLAEFDSWEDVYETAGYEWEDTEDIDIILNTSASGTDIDTAATGRGVPNRSDLLQEIRDIASTTHRPLEETDVTNTTQYSIDDITQIFDSWQHALDAAGVDNEMRLINDLYRVTGDIGHRPSPTEMNEHGYVPVIIYEAYFGTYTTAIEQAFNETENPRQTAYSSEKVGDQNPSREELLEELEQLNNKWSKIDRKLLYSVSDYHPEEYEDAFGSLDAALMIAGVKDADRPAPTKADTDTKNQTLPDGRIDTLTITVVGHVPNPGSKRDAQLHVELTDGTEVPLNIWSTHDLSIDWTVGDTYTIEQARHKSWETSTRTAHELSSTKDFSVTSTGASSTDTKPDINPPLPADTDTDSATGSSHDTSTSSGQRTSNTARNQTRSSGTPSRGELLDAIRHVAETDNRPLKASDVGDATRCSVNDITLVFGSWQNALDSAGIDNEARLIEDLRRVADKLGHRPTTTEMNDHGHVSATTYATYFGTYTAAIDEAFDEAEPASSPTGTDTADRSKSTGTDPESGKVTDTTITEINTEGGNQENASGDDNTTTDSDDDGIISDIMNDFNELSDSRFE